MQLKNLFFSSSTSRNSPKNQGSIKLTRQRKLRYVTDRQLGLSRSQVSPADSPTPQPLPRPDFMSKEGTSKWEDGRKLESVNIKGSSLSFDRRSTEGTSKRDKISSPGPDRRSTEGTSKREEERKVEFADFKVSSSGSDRRTMDYVNHDLPRRDKKSDQSISHRSKGGSCKREEDRKVDGVNAMGLSLRSDRRSNRGSDWSSSQRVNEWTSKGEEERKHENSNIKVSSMSCDRSYLSGQFVDKTKNHPTTKSVKHPTYCRREFPPSLDDGSACYNLKVNIPAKSAPTTTLSSPIRSTQRFNSLDSFPSCSSPQFLFPSTPRVNVSSNRGKVSQFSKFPEKYSDTPNHSPLHSPKKRSGSQNTNHQNLHRLPLPPSSPKHIQSPPSKTATVKPEASSRKSQWTKGKLIGRGTYGTVFEAFNSETGAMCAMKEVDLMPDDPKSLECIKQLEHEIKILQQLEHKNIVQYYGCEVVDDHFCIYLEYVYPGSICKYMREHSGAIKESVLRNFTRHILSGLAYLHSTDTVHRDIKGANLLVDASGVVKLADFGLAKHLTTATIDLSLKGSPHWMAPELLQAVMRKDSGNQHAYAIDIWSLGCTVIEMFSGKPPWSEYTGVQALFHVMNKSPAIPESLSSEGKDFLHWCFKRNPADRPLAAHLLKHSFVQITQDQGFPTCTLDFSGTKIAASPNSLLGASCSPRERPSICKSLPTSPHAQVRKLPNNGWRSNPESSRGVNDQGASYSARERPSICKSLPTSPRAQVRQLASNGWRSNPESSRGVHDQGASYSARERPSICKSLPTSPRAQVRQLASNGWRSNHDSSRAVPDQPPHSTSEALPSVTSRVFNGSSAINSSLFTSSPDNLRFATAYNYQNINRKARKGFFHSFEGLKLTNS